MLEKEHLIVIIMLIAFFLIAIVWLYFTRRSIRIQKRIENHIISSTSLENLSLLDQINSHYQKWKQKMIKKVEGMKLGKEFELSKQRNIEFSSMLGNWIDQILCSILFIVVYLFFCVLGITPFKMIFLLLVGIVGFSMVHFIIWITKRTERKQIETDLLKAISLMNNAFQSGKSIIQAIQVVTLELDGPLSLEFSKIYQDILHGLSFESAFIRFQERVKLEELEYITASLSILNKTGGNITRIFSSIESNLYTRRKLEMELKATVASSKLVFQLLTFLPIFLWVLIGLWNPNYFSVFFQSVQGMLLFSIMICIYLIYIIMIYNIMKIEKY